EFEKAAADNGWNHEEIIKSSGHVEITEYFSSRDGAARDGAAWEMRILYRADLKLGAPLQRVIWTASKAGLGFKGFMFLSPNTDKRLQPDQVNHPLARAMLLKLAGETIRDPGTLVMVELREPGLPELAIITDNEAGAAKLANQASIERYVSWAAAHPREWPLLVISGDTVQLRFDKILSKAADIKDFVDWSLSLYRILA
ncbi:MAG: hypothetical protein ABIJ86_01585, partial [Spirochaetota bacterium]